MAKYARANNMRQIWLWGKCYEFFIVTTDGRNGNLTEDLCLNEPKIVNGIQTNTPEDYAGTLNNPTTSQKTQIVLHCTAGNSSAENTINWWNNPSSPAASAHYVVERTSSNQIARPGIQNDSDKQDTNTVDAVRLMPENSITYHGGVVNTTSIGIEISNVGWGFQYTNTANEPTLNIPHTPESTCPTRINIGTAAHPRWRCSHRRPLDENRYIQLQQPLGGHTDYQAFEDEQYTTLILLLRHLCIEHRIPRTFLGRNTEDVFRHYCWSLRNFSNQSRQRRRDAAMIFHYRGILHHRNVHANKPCPGIVHRNRLFRGITDEWWLPVEMSGNIRNYYSGPFQMPEYQNNQPTRPGFFKWKNITNGNQPDIDTHTYHDADLDALMSIDSFYNPVSIETYYALCESEHGGIFPIGLNKIWHGGSHFYPLQVYPVVYAAASGTIVAARVSSNDTTERHEHFGSQRFVLIRHYVHMETENDPDGVGERINYSTQPGILFSLYMHLSPFADLENENNANPPWFNLWLRAHRSAEDRRSTGMTDDGEKGRVFNPDIEVNIGDVLGSAGQYAGQQHCLHFEVFSHRDSELTFNPWDDNNFRFDDSNDTDAICDLDTIDRYVRDQNNDGLDVFDIIHGARLLRNAKTLNKSEWSLENADSLTPVVASATRREALWEHINRLTWWREALAANDSLEEQIGNDGIVWHYHPVTFIDFINQRVQGENREISEDEYADTNVEVDEDYFLTRFIGKVNNNYVSENADNEALKPFRVAHTSLNYHFARQEIACQICISEGVHPQVTHFNLALLDAMERIRLYSNIPMTVTNSHICTNHLNNADACCNNNADGRTQHNRGHAVDFRPSNTSSANCTNLYNTVRDFIATAFHPQANMRGGNIFQDCLPPEYCGMEMTVHPVSARNKLSANPQQALTPAERNSFCIHLCLSQTPSPQPEIDEDVEQPDQYTLSIRFLSVEVINDSDWFGKGEWELSGFVNDVKVAEIKTSVSSGDTISLPDQWTHQITVGENNAENLRIVLSGKENDLIFDDDLGTARITFNAESTPAPWGIGTQVLSSSKGKYTATVEIQNANSEMNNI